MNELEWDVSPGPLIAFSTYDEDLLTLDIDRTTTRRARGVPGFPPSLVMIDAYIHVLMG